MRRLRAECVNQRCSGILESSETLVTVPSHIVLAFAPKFAAGGAQKHSSHWQTHYCSCMQTPLNPTVWLMLTAALLGSPAAAAAQEEQASIVVDAPSLSATQLREPEPAIDTRDVIVSIAESHRDGPFRFVSAAFFVAASADLSVSMYQVGRGAARETGFGAQWQDSPVAFALTKSAMSAAFVYGLQRMHRTRPKTALVLGLVATAFEGWLTVRGVRISATQP
jgi:hypothetical protein